jgi:hypothetical protein
VVWRRTALTVKELAKAVFSAPWASSNSTEQKIWEELGGAESFDPHFVGEKAKLLPELLQEVLKTCTRMDRRGS